MNKASEKRFARLVHGWLVREKCDSSCEHHLVEFLLLDEVCCVMNQATLKSRYWLARPWNDCPIDVSIVTLFLSLSRLFLVFDPFLRSLIH